jgi:hypothetical protein
MNNNQIKFTPEELNEIKSLGEKYQNKLSQFGVLYLERLSIEAASKDLIEKEKKLKDDYNDIQKEEKIVIDKLTSKYGEGNLSLSDGTFTPTKLT